jgi:hypothetical protein
MAKDKKPKAPKWDKLGSIPAALSITARYELLGHLVKFLVEEPEDPTDPIYTRTRKDVLELAQIIQGWDIA